MSNFDFSGVPESLVNQVIELLGTLGITPSGTVRESNDVWCVFNDWQARDQRANGEGTFEEGRFSIGTTFGGRWYCCKKRER